MRCGNRMAAKSCYREKTYPASETHIGIVSSEALPTLKGVQSGEFFGYNSNCEKMEID
jgi:hypothetical protein